MAAYGVRSRFSLADEKKQREMQASSPVEQNEENRKDKHSWLLLALLHLSHSVFTRVAVQGYSPVRSKHEEPTYVSCATVSRGTTGNRSESLNGKVHTEYMTRDIGEYFL